MHPLVVTDGLHLQEVGPGEVVVHLIEVSRPAVVLSSTVSRGRPGDDLLGCKLFAEHEAKGPHVPAVETCNDGLYSVVFGRKDVGPLQDFVTEGEGWQDHLLHGSSQDWLQEILVKVMFYLVRVVFIGHWDGQAGHSDGPASLVLLQVVQLAL